jgi:hypothetical protein
MLVSEIPDYLRKGETYTLLKPYQNVDDKYILQKVDKIETVYEFKRAFASAIYWRLKEIPIQIYIYCLFNIEIIDKLLYSIKHIKYVENFHKNLYKTIIENKKEILTYIKQNNINTHLVYKMYM